MLLLKNMYFTTDKENQGHGTIQDKNKRTKLDQTRHNNIQFIDDLFLLLMETKLLSLQYIQIAMNHPNYFTTSYLLISTLKCLFSNIEPTIVQRVYSFTNMNFSTFTFILFQFLFVVVVVAHCSCSLYCFVVEYKYFLLENLLQLATPDMCEI